MKLPTTPGDVSLELVAETALVENIVALTLEHDDGLLNGLEGEERPAP